VWDTIHSRDPGRSEPHEEWGGIAYALSTFEALRPSGWSLFPILKIGWDLAPTARTFLTGLRCAPSLDGVRTVTEPNNRVELRYLDGSRRTEKLRGGVPGWSWNEFEPLARSCDALYVNFIAGWELDLACARRLRESFEGPLYGDIHSLTLGVGPDGTRVPRVPERWREWLLCFDYVQANEDELGLLAADWGGDPWRLAAEAVGEGVRALFVTLGERGAAWFAAEESPGWASGTICKHGPVRSGRVAAARVRRPDPTGCGDVWGMTCFCALLEGASVQEAALRANRMAERNAELRGATRLAELLRQPRGILHRGEP
jgi:hypothetical protein